MSSNIWTQSAARSKVRPLTAEPWRVVEAQHRIATRKLVDSDHEQVLLEELLDTAKPPMPADSRLHYLLATPFRYPPLPHGSRFGTRWDPGIWYGSDALRTALAEVAYYRLVFLDGTSANLGAVETELSAYRAPVTAPHGLDLSAPWFARWRDVVSSKTSYADSQLFGTDMRAAGVEAFRYTSARDEAGGTNVGLLTTTVFGSRRPRSLQTWHSISTRQAVEFTTRDYFERKTYRFEREPFLVDGALPHPAVP